MSTVNEIGPRHFDVILMPPQIARLHSYSENTNQTPPAVIEFILDAVLNNVLIIPHLTALTNPETN